MNVQKKKKTIIETAGHKKLSWSKEKLLLKNIFFFADYCLIPVTVGSII